MKKVCKDRCKQLLESSYDPSTGEIILSDRQRKHLDDCEACLGEYESLLSMIRLYRSYKTPRTRKKRTIKT